MDICSPHCKDTACDQDSGICSNGCKPGYYLAPCNASCSQTCQSSCDYLNGSCTDGCMEGFNGSLCESCQDGLFGDMCDKTCENCKDGRCDRVTGNCTLEGNSDETCIYTEYMDIDVYIHRTVL